MQNINRTILTGNLTRDPEMRQAGSGLAVANLRVACNGRVKQQGEWVDKVNYFDVVCFGSQAENVEKFLKKGRPVAIDGRLDWSEWTAQDGARRQSVQIVADSIQFLSDGNRDGDRGHSPAIGGTADAPPVTTAPADDDIPF